jgi:hypothetical protein
MRNGEELPSPLAHQNPNIKKVPSKPKMNV